MQEVWRTVVTEEGIYENYKVSNLGRVKSLNYHREKREKILSPDEDRYGYLRVVLCKNGKTKRYIVHRLVAMAFIPNIMNYNCIDHRDTNKKNNNVLNLTWVTHKQNNNNELTKKKRSETKKGTRYKIKKVICLETGEIFNSVGETARQLKINITSIADVCNKKYKQTHNMTFRYLDQVLFYN